MALLTHRARVACNAMRQRLTGTTYELPGEVHLSRRAAIFEMQRKPDTVQFAGSELSVGIVPVIEIANRPGRTYFTSVVSGIVEPMIAPRPARQIVHENAGDRRIARTQVHVMKPASRTTGSMAALSASHPK